MRTVLFLVFSFAAVGSFGSARADGERSTGPEKSVGERLARRNLPSVFQAWGRADNLRGQDRMKVMALHDLVWLGVENFGLEWDKRPSGLAEAFKPESLERGRKMRQRLLELNPNIILIAEIRYRDAGRGFLPTDHEWWMRDNKGNLVSGWAEGRFIRLDFSNPKFREHIVRRAKAVVESGVVDGVMLDWWSDDEHRLALVKAVRKAIGEKYLIIANANDRTTPRTAPYINGYFMECYKSRTADDWKRIAATLEWAEKNLRPPRVNCVETWYHKSRMDVNLMRAVTTLSLTHSNGYCLFSDPNPLPSGDHLHNWYPFWDKSLGKAISKGRSGSDGTISREFENGTVVYNPMGNKTVTVVFTETRTSAAGGKSLKKHVLKSPDGDIFLRLKAK